MASNPCALAEQPIENSSDNERSQHHYGEAPCPKLHAVDEVHTKQTGDKRREHQDNANTGHLLHHVRHIIVDNIGVSIHCRIKNVWVDIGGFPCLIHLNVDILDEVSVQLIHRELELQFTQQCFVTTNGGDEVGQTIL